MLKIRNDGILIPWDMLPESILKRIGPERRFESSSSQILERVEVADMKIGMQLREVLERILAMATIAEQDEAAAEALAEALDELGETKEGLAVLAMLK